jgi:hypothetical protein
MSDGSRSDGSTLNHPNVVPLSDAGGSWVWASRSEPLSRNFSALTVGPVPDAVAGTVPTDR